MRNAMDKFVITSLRVLDIQSCEIYVEAIVAQPKIPA